MIWFWLFCFPRAFLKLSSWTDFEVLTHTDGHSSCPHSSTEDCSPRNVNVVEGEMLMIPPSCHFPPEVTLELFLCIPIFLILKRAIGRIQMLVIQVDLQFEEVLSQPAASTPAHEHRLVLASSSLLFPFCSPWLKPEPSSPIGSPSQSCDPKLKHILQNSLTTPYWDLRSRLNQSSSCRRCGNTKEIRWLQLCDFLFYFNLDLIEFAQLFIFTFCDNVI